ncbi:SGNH hydrolase domain-containing protein, partial [Acinetobacter variabilis]|uniref:SGNH hydrolase domain-containing protein n=1 Tax=Acinetobacter variabilis TaxID=70346 RepID=UPI002FD8BFE2
DPDPVCITNQKEGGVFLWGDSHTEALSLGLRTLLKSNDIPFYQKTSSICRASLTEINYHKGAYKEACDYSNKLALKSIAELKPKIVVITQALKHDETNWENIGKSLLQLGVSNIVIVGPISQWKPSLPKVMVKPKNWNSAEDFIFDAGLDLRAVQVDEKMKKLQYPQGITYISLIDHLCKKDDVQQQYKCRIRAAQGEDLLQVDYGHLSESGSLFVGNTILSKYLLNLYSQSVTTNQ